MRFRKLGNTGISVSEIGFGAWPIGNGAFDYGAVDEEEAIAALIGFRERDGNFIDTARAYGERSERLIGESTRRFGNRDSLIVATKTMGGDAFATMGNIRKDAVVSLRTIGTDYLDILQLHQPPEDPELMENALYELQELKKEGKIRFIGASIKGPNVTDATEALCKMYIDSGKVDCIQVVYSVLRQKLSPTIDYAASCGIGVFARTVLESGFLTDRFASLDAVPEYRAPDQRSRYSHNRLEDISDRCRSFKRLCDEALGTGHTARTAIAFVLSRDSVSSALLGMRRKEHLEQNMDASEGLHLSDAIFRRIAEEFGDITERMNYP